MGWGRTTIMDNEYSFPSTNTCTFRSRTTTSSLSLRTLPHTLWWVARHNANNTNRSGFMTSRHGTHESYLWWKMAGFGASRQPKKSSVNLYIQYFLYQRCDRRKNCKSSCKGFLPTIKLVNLSTGGHAEFAPNCASHIDPKRTVRTLDFLRLRVN